MGHWRERDAGSHIGSWTWVFCIAVVKFWKAKHWTDVVFISMGDQAHNNRPKGDSTDGLVTLAAGPDCASGHVCTMSLLAWGTWKLKRKAISSNDAEVQSILEAEDQLQGSSSVVRTSWCWLGLAPSSGFGGPCRTSSAADQGNPLHGFSWRLWCCGGEWDSSSWSFKSSRSIASISAARKSSSGRLRVAMASRWLWFGRCTDQEKIRMPWWPLQIHEDMAMINSIWSQLHFSKEVPRKLARLQLARLKPLRIKGHPLSLFHGSFLVDDWSCIFAYDFWSTHGWIFLSGCCNICISAISASLSSAGPYLQFGVAQGAPLFVTPTELFSSRP